MIKTSDGVEVPGLLVLANKIADASSNIPGSEDTRRRATATEVAFAFSLLFERHPEYAQNMLVEFRWWTMRHRDFFHASTIEQFETGELSRMIDLIPEQLPVDMPHGH